MHPERRLQPAPIQLANAAVCMQLVDSASFLEIADFVYVTMNINIRYRHMGQNGAYGTRLVVVSNAELDLVYGAKRLQK